MIEIEGVVFTADEDTVLVSCVGSAGGRSDAEEEEAVEGEDGEGEGDEGEGEGDGDGSAEEGGKQEE